jgi:Raf kinase inhibitor-like YbhB/YbcL family protein
MAAMRVTSPAYSEGQAIPPGFTCDGEDRSPPLEIQGLPVGTRFVALVLDDPDAPGGTWTHWTFWDLPAAHASLPAAADVKALGARQGTTSARSVGYHGPCPPGGTHRYVVRVYALASQLALPDGATVAALQDALKGKALASATLTGVYSRGK